MAFLTKEQIANIINNRPVGTTPEGIVAALRQEGYQIEGLDLPQENQPLEKPTISFAEKPEDKTPLLGKIIAGGTGLSALLETSKAVAAPITSKAVQDIEEQRQRLIDNATLLANRIKSATDADKRSRLMKLFNEQIDLINQMQEEAQKIRGETETSVGKIAGSTGEGLLGVATAGLPSIGGKIGLGVASKIAPPTPIVSKTLELGGKAAEQAALGAGFKATQNIKEEKPITQDIGSSATLGAAIPVAGSLLSLVGKGGVRAVATIGKIFTDKEALEIAFKNPQVVESAMRYIQANAKKPFLQMVKDVGGKLQQVFDDTKNAYEKAINSIPQTKVFKFSVSNDFFKNSFRSFGILLKENKGGALMVANKDAIKSLPSKAINGLEEIVQDMSNAKSLTLFDVRNLKNNIEALRNFVPEGHTRKNEWDKMVEILSNKFDNLVEKNIPELAQINKQYNKVADVYYKFKDKFIDKVERDNSGNVIRVLPSEKGERYLANLFKENKGQVLKNIKKLEDLTGLKVSDEVKILNVAKSLEPQISAFKALAAKGGAGLVTGALGLGLTGNPALSALLSLASIAAASPKIAGRVAITSGKVKQQGEKIIETMPQPLKTLLQRAGVLK